MTSLITAGNQWQPHAGPFPCLSYRTLRDTLDAKKLSWRYYAPAVGQSFGGDLWNAFDAIAAVRNGPEWNTNQVSPETQVFTDISRDTLPAVSWVIPDFANSDHPGGNSDTGPSWVAQVVNAIGESPAWNTTAVVVVWDDWGGWYDHVAPPGTRRFGGLGFRVPAIFISPYSKDGYVAHDEYEFGASSVSSKTTGNCRAWERPTSPPEASSATFSTSVRRRVRSYQLQRNMTVHTFYSRFPPVNPLTTSKR